MSKFKIAVIGVGYLGEFHAQKYHTNKKVELIGIVDTNKKRCCEISNILGVNSYSDYKNIVNIVDAVSIVVPTDLHYKVAKFFIENGKHVLIEKPFATNVNQAKKLIKLAKQYKVILQIGHLERFNKVFLSLEKNIRNPLFFECNRLSPYKIRGTEVDVIMDLMIHDLDIILSLNKSKIKSIHANGINVLTNTTDIAHARITFENGCVCNLSASRISDKVERKMRVFQKNAYFSLDYQNYVLDTYNKTESKGIKKIEKKKVRFIKNDSLNEEIKSFIECIAAKKNPIVSGNDGLAALKYAIKISNLIKK